MSSTLWRHTGTTNPLTGRKSLELVSPSGRRWVFDDDEITKVVSLRVEINRQLREATAPPQPTFDVEAALSVEPGPPQPFKPEGNEVEQPTCGTCGGALAAGWRCGTCVCPDDPDCAGEGDS